MEIDHVDGGSEKLAVTPSVEKAAANVSAAVTLSRINQVKESLKLEHQLLRVPFEHYKKTIRANHRSFEKDVSFVLSGVNDLACADLPKDEAISHLGTLMSRLQGIKRKLNEGNYTENCQVQRCRARINELESVDPENLSEWNNKRVNRILVDYMLRMSYFETATKLAESAKIQNVQFKKLLEQDLHLSMMAGNGLLPERLDDLVDIDIFGEAKTVIDALKNKKVAPALAWCTDNKARLKKSKSKFEFQLRLQEFVELVRADTNESYKRAVIYARRHLAPSAATHMKEFLHTVAILAFKSNTECPKYKVLFENKQWDSLVDQFKQEFCKLYGMTMEPLLNIYLQAGLSALKTPYCYEDNCTKEDPLSQESFRKLAEHLPYSKQHQSKLVCYITKELMDTENPPQVLPNGYVYSTKALKEMADKNGGKITCPRTGLVCKSSELVKAFIS